MTFRGYSELDRDDRSGLLQQVVRQRQRVTERLKSVEHIVAVMSGKGGVGKSYITAMLAGAAVSRWPDAVGVVDADLGSPTVARLLDARGPLRVDQDGVHPARGVAGIRVVSTDLLLPEGQPLRWREPAAERFVWRGTLEAGTTREFLSDVVWGSLGLLVIDLPPGPSGAGDIAALIPRFSGAIVVTIPSRESERSVARTIQAANDEGIRVLGIVENMTGYCCPGCSTTMPLFEGSAGEQLARTFEVPILGRIPFDSQRRPTMGDDVSRQLWASFTEALG